MPEGLCYIREWVTSMKKKTILILLLHVCLVTVSVLPVLGDTLPSEQTAQKENENEEASMQAGQDGQYSVSEIATAVLAAMEQTTPDLESSVIQEFLEASDAYDALEKSQKEQISLDIVEKLETVRERIAAILSTDCGFTVTGNPWYVKLEITDGTNTQEILEKLVRQYEKTSPQIVLYKQIRYTDIRTGEEYKPMTPLSMTVPAVEGYQALTRPMVLRNLGDSFLDLSPVIQENGDFYISSARTLNSVLVVDLPAGLEGISLNHETLKINKGQKRTLEVSPIPASVTEEYTVSWSSSNPSVAKVSEKGVVTAEKKGKAVITAKVNEHPDMRAVCEVTIMQGANELKKSVSQVMKETKQYMLSIDKSPTVGSEWFVLGLARSGMSLQDPYFSTYYNHTANYIEEQRGILTNTFKYTEYSKRVLSLTAMGKDARNVGGYNLFQYLSDFDKVKGQGLNGPIWALLALNSNPEYSFPKNTSVQTQTTEEILLEYLVGSEINGGGWAMMGNVPDSDVTAMALQALAPYYNKAGYEEVTAAIDRGLEVLSSIQLDNGGYATVGVETEESCAQVIVALCSLGIDPQTDERFIKGGNWTMENLLSYHIDESGFMHVKAGTQNNGGGAAGTVNGMATEQGYYAMTAYQRLKNGKTGLYDMSDVKIEKGGKGDGNGTGLATPTPKPSATPGGSGTSVTKSSDSTKTAGKTEDSVASTAKTTSSSGEGKTASSKSKNKTKEDGWNFDAEEWTPDEEEWEFDALPFSEVESESGEDVAERQSGRETGRQSLPFAMGIAGGVGTWGILECVRFLYRKRK